MPFLATGALAEGISLAIFMFSACTFGFLLEHPGSLVRSFIPDPSWRRLLMGVLMGGTAVLLIHSRMGRFSGAHLNPASTLAYWRLSRIGTKAAMGYMVAQTLGAILGVGAARLFLGPRLQESPVDYVKTVPGSLGAPMAFLAEIGMAFTMMLAMLIVTRMRRLAPYAGLFAGLLIAGFIGFLAPVSGMSLNPARSLASALWSGDFQDFWIYVAAPPLGMLAAAELRLRTGRVIPCAKIIHDPRFPCVSCGPGSKGDKIGSVESNGSPAIPQSEVIA